MVARAVERARAALDGEILPEAALPDLPALTDEEIADAGLLTGDEFKQGFVVNESRTDAISLDAGTAATISACGPYAETLATFADATERTRWFTSGNGAHDYRQYTVVFADEQAAESAFDMLDDATFVAECAVPLQAQQVSIVPVTATTEIGTTPVGEQSQLLVSSDGYLEYRIRFDRVLIVLTGGDSGDQTQAQFQATAAHAVQKVRLALEGIVLPQ
jgi:hypothetical protein